MHNGVVALLCCDPTSVCDVLVLINPSSKILCFGLQCCRLLSDVSQHIGVMCLMSVHVCCWHVPQLHEGANVKLRVL